MPIRCLILVLLFTLIPLAGCSENPDTNIKMIDYALDAAERANAKVTFRHVSEGGILSAGTRTTLGPDQTTVFEFEADFTGGD